MYELKKKIGKVLTSKSVGTGPSYYEKRIYRAAVSQRLRNTALLLLSETFHILRTQRDITKNVYLSSRTCYLVRFL